MWWNRKKPLQDEGARIASLRLRVEGIEDQVTKLARAITDLQMGLAKNETEVLSLVRKARRSGAPVTDAIDTESPAPPSEALRQVAIRRGSYGVPTRVPDVGGDGNGR